MKARAPVAALAALILGGCGGHTASTATTTNTPTKTTAAIPQTIRVTSPTFAAGGTIPRAYTCDGADTPPPLRWSGVPSHAQSLTLVMRDPDAPGGDFIHWSVTRIPATVTHIGGGASLPPDAIAGRNGFGSAGYRGPCPPQGAKPHHYVITVTAYDAADAPVAAGKLTGTYGR